MLSLIRKYELRNAVKEALDNLPSGVCFFNDDGVLLLCNSCMYRLAYMLLGYDLQLFRELKEAMERLDEADPPGGIYHLQDDSWWSFSVHEITGHTGKCYTEVTAFDVSELHRKQELLQEANEAVQRTVETLERIQDNIVAITREEEILAMKMELHSEFGYHLQAIRRFYQQGCPAGDKADFLADQRDAARKLRGELEGSDETDPFDELSAIAGKLDMEISVIGQLPKQAQLRGLLAEALRECMTNTLRHAEGSRVYMELAKEERSLTACIANDGHPPAGEIVEGGGLSSLRKRVESCGGTMSVRSMPEYLLKITLPIEEETL